MKQDGCFNTELPDEAVMIGRPSPHLDALQAEREAAAEFSGAGNVVFNPRS